MSIDELEKSDGYKKSKALISKIKEDREKMEAKNVEGKKLAVVELQGIQVSQETANLYRQTSNVGMENVSEGGMPQLKVIQDKSRDRFDDGTKPATGSLFYAPTKKDYKRVNVSIVTVSRGFWTIRVDQNGEPKMGANGIPETKFNQLVGGVILDTMEPFIHFVSGEKWPIMNEFVKSIRPFTKHKTMPIPMYAFQVSLESTITKSENFAVEYTIVKNDKKQAVLTDDVELIKFFLKSADNFKEMTDSFIDRVEVDRNTAVLISNMEPEAEPVKEAIAVAPEVQSKFNAIVGKVEEPTPTGADLVTDEEDVSDDVPF